MDGSATPPFSASRTDSPAVTAFRGVPYDALIYVDACNRRAYAYVGLGFAHTHHSLDIGFRSTKQARDCARTQGDLCSYTSCLEGRLHTRKKGALYNNSYTINTPCLCKHLHFLCMVWYWTCGAMEEGSGFGVMPTHHTRTLPAVCTIKLATQWNYCVAAHRAFPWDLWAVSDPSILLACPPWFPCRHFFTFNSLTFYAPPACNGWFFCSSRVHYTCLYRRLCVRHFASAGSYNHHMWRVAVSRLASRDRTGFTLYAYGLRQRGG